MPSASYFHRWLSEVTEGIKLNSRGLRLISESDPGHMTHHLLAAMTNQCPSTYKVLVLLRNPVSGAGTLKKQDILCWRRECVVVTCAFVWNTVAFEVSWVHFTCFIRLTNTLLVLPLLIFSCFLLIFLIFTLFLFFMLFWFLLGLAVEGWTLVLGTIYNCVSGRGCANARCAKYRWSREKRRRLAEPLRHWCFLRVTISPVVAGVIADVRQSLERARDVQQRELLGAWCHATVWHRNRHSCLHSTRLSSSIRGAELAVNRTRRNLAGKVRYPGLFVDEGVDEVRSRSFLAKKKKKEYLEAPPKNFNMNSSHRTMREGKTVSRLEQTKMAWPVEDRGVCRGGNTVKATTKKPSIKVSEAEVKLCQSWGLVKLKSKSLHYRWALFNPDAQWLAFWNKLKLKLFSKNVRNNIFILIFHHHQASFVYTDIVSSKNLNISSYIKTKKNNFSVLPFKIG